MLHHQPVRLRSTPRPTLAVTQPTLMSVSSLPDRMRLGVESKYDTCMGTRERMRLGVESKYETCMGTWERMSLSARFKCDSCMSTDQRSTLWFSSPKSTRPKKHPVVLRPPEEPAISAE